MNPYEVLDIDESASDDDIKAAYKSKAQKAHPDRGGDAQKFKEAAVAYAQLKNRQETPVDKMLKELFAILIDEQSFRGDLIARATGLVKESLTVLEKKRGKLSIDINRLGKLTKRVDHPLWIDMTEGRLISQEKELVVVERNIKTAEKLLDQLNGLKDLAPDPAWNSASGFGEL